MVSTSSALVFALSSLMISSCWVEGGSSSSSSRSRSSSSSSSSLSGRSGNGDALPNILLLFPDQWRFDWNPQNSDAVPLSIPTVAKLAREGTWFEHAYVPAPVCAPSRSCLASGREYDLAGVPTNFHNDYDLNIPTFFSALQDAG